MGMARAGIFSRGFLLFFLGLGVCGSAAAAHDEECMAAWKRSSAYPTCTIQDWMTRSGDSCRIYVRCTTHYREVEGTRLMTNAGEQTITGWKLGDVDKLSNCNGSLKLGSC